MTTRVPGTAASQGLGRDTQVIRLGVPIPRFRQLYSVPAARLVPDLAGDADLVHAHVGEDLAVLPIAARAVHRHDIPLVVTVHCSLRHTLKAVDVRTSILKMIGGRIEERVLRTASGVIVLTARLASHLVSCGIGTDRVHVISPGVDAKLFDACPDDPLPHVGKPRVLFVGRLVRAKGVHELLHAFRSLQNHDVNLVFVGDGAERVALERSVDSLGLRDRVRFTGFVPHDHVPAFMAHADALVLPSLYEELGSILLEAMQSGLPIVASGVGGIPDVVKHEDNGLLVRAGDVAALTRAVDRVLGDAPLAASLVRGGRRTSGQGWTTVSDKVLGVYEHALSIHGPREGRSDRFIWRASKSAAPAL